jgi:hypothetical protein
MLTFKQTNRLLWTKSKLILKKIAIVFALIFVATDASSQLVKDLNSVSIQTNIFLNENLFTGGYIQPVYALRYRYNINNRIIIGPEISGTRTFFRSINIRDTKSTTMTLGGFGRYAILPEKRVSPFAELSLYYFRSHFVPSSDPVASTLNERIINKFSGFIAPGISLKSKSSKVSLDLMYKFSPDYFINSRHSVFSYRFNFHF